MVVDHYANPDNRYSVGTECGFLEVLNIKPFGELVAKFDTGNSAASTMHADKIKVNDKTVTWSYGGKTLKNRIIRIANVHVGGLNNYTENIRQMY